VLYKSSPPHSQYSAADGRAGNALHCGHCGKLLHPKRGSRRQRYCGPKCREAVRRGRNFAVFAATRTPSLGKPRSVENSLLTSTACKVTFGDRAYSIDGPREVVETEIIAGRVWHPVKSPDGVTCQVARIRLVDGPIAAGLISRWEPTWSPTSREVPNLPIPDFLRRPLPAAKES
jgi:hypothetical protein